MYCILYIHCTRLLPSPNCFEINGRQTVPAELFLLGRFHSSAAGGWPNVSRETKAAWSRRALKVELRSGLWDWDVGCCSCRSNGCLLPLKLNVWTFIYLLYSMVFTFQSILGIFLRDFEGCLPLVSSPISRSWCSSKRFQFATNAKDRSSWKNWKTAIWSTEKPSVMKNPSICKINCRLGPSTIAKWSVFWALGWHRPC